MLRTYYSRADNIYKSVQIPVSTFLYTYTQSSNTAPTTNVLIASDTFQVIHGELYVKACFAADGGDTLSVIRRRLSLQSYTYQQSRFKWSETDHEKFQVVAHAVGVSTVTPKQIRLFLPHISSTQIASHLQKYRRKIAHCYGLRSSEEIRNYMTAYAPAGSTVAKICERWANVAEFEGFTCDEISIMLL